MHLQYLGKTIKPNKENNASLEGNMTGCIWRCSEENEHERIIVSTSRLMQVKVTADWRQSEYIYIHILSFSSPQFQKALSTVAVKEVLLSEPEFTLFDIWSQLHGELQVDEA